MTTEDVEAFVALLGETAELMGVKAPSKMALNIYFRTLKDFRLSDVRRAVSDHIRTCPFFPRPCEVVARIEGTPEDRILLAWQEVLTTLERHGSYVSVRFSSPTIHWALARMGGWPRLGEMTYREEPFRGKDFAYWFARAEKLGVTWDDVPGCMAGRIEMNNMRQKHDPTRLGLKDAYIGEVVAACCNVGMTAHEVRPQIAGR